MYVHESVVWTLKQQPNMGRLFVDRRMTALNSILQHTTRERQVPYNMYLVCGACTLLRGCFYCWMRPVYVFQQPSEVFSHLFCKHRTRDAH